jgi:hypothetical protein
MREATVDPRTKVVKITTAITVVTSLDGDAAMRCDAMRCDSQTVSQMQERTQQEIKRAVVGLVLG